MIPESKLGSQKQPEKRLQDILEDYAEKSSIHGVVFIKSAQNYEKVLWILFFMFGLVASITHISYLTVKYFKYQTHAAVEMKFGSLIFPAVTICNVNLMRMSQKSQSLSSVQSLLSYLETIEKDVYNATAFRELQEKNEQTFTRWSNTVEYAQCTHCGDCWQYEKGRYGKTSLFSLENFFTFLYNQQTMLLRQILGHTWSDMLKACTFAGKTCPKELFHVKPVASPAYGNCYTLESDAFVTSLNGPNNGLELFIYIEREEYVPVIKASAGARVILHPNGTSPFHDDNDIAVTPGTETYIGLRQTVINRLGLPYTSCYVHSGSNTNGYLYTKSACQKYCEQTIIHETCGCEEYEVDLLGTHVVKKETDYHMCNSTTELLCMHEVLCQFPKIETKTCQCDDPCKEYIYKKTVNSLQWHPTDGYLRFFQHEVCNINNSSTICSANVTVIRASLLKVNIYFEDLNYDSIQYLANYELYNFMADIGGSTGLWIGISMLSLFELVHLVIAILHNTYRNIVNQKHYKFRRKFAIQENRKYSMSETTSQMS